MEKYYMVEENELIELLANAYEKIMLERDGVDNWTWYGEGRKDVIKERFPELDESQLEDMDFYDCARADLNDYRLVD